MFNKKNILRKIHKIRVLYCEFCEFVLQNIFNSCFDANFDRTYFALIYFPKDK